MYSVFGLLFLYTGYLGLRTASQLAGGIFVVAVGLFVVLVIGLVLAVTRLLVVDKVMYETAREVVSSGTATASSGFQKRT
jgi:hypothetical protein